MPCLTPTADTRGGNTATNHKSIQRCILFNNVSSDVHFLSLPLLFPNESVFFCSLVPSSLNHAAYCMLCLLVFFRHCSLRVHFNHWSQWLHFLFMFLFLHACVFSQRKQPHGPYIVMHSRQASFYSLITLIVHCKCVSPLLSKLNPPWRRQRMSTLFSSLCFGHSFILCDTLREAVSQGQHVIFPLGSN